MSKITLATVTNLLGNPTSAANNINNNSDTITAAFDNTLSRNGISPNQMNADLDMNHNDLLNVDTVNADVLILAGQNVGGTAGELIYLGQAVAAAAASAASATASGNSATAAAASAAAAVTTLSTRTAQVADKAAVLLLDTTTVKTAVTYADGANGQRNSVWSWVSSDLSGILCRTDRIFSSAACVASTDVITWGASHTLSTGQAMLCTASTATGVTINTIYYVIRLTATTFKLATTWANAVAGTAVNITVDGTCTLASYSDVRQIIYAIPSGKSLTGSQGAWVRQGSLQLNPVLAGAALDGTTDDTDAFQATINAAILLRRPVYWVGVGVISSTLYGYGNFRMSGAGFQGERGRVYDAAYDTVPVSSYASVLKPNGNFAVLSVQTQGSVNFENFEIWKSGAQGDANSVGVSVIRPDNTAVGSADEMNVYSRFTNISVTFCGYGFAFQDVYDFRMTGCAVFDCSQWAVNHGNNIFPSYSDCLIDGCQFFNNTLGGVNWQSGGGLKFCNNKVNYGGASSIALLFAPTFNVGAQIEPTVITGNSIEGQNSGIVLNRASGDTQMQQVVITGNQIWVGASCINFVDPGAAWITGVTISGNSLTSSVSGVTPVSISATSNCIVSGNNIALSAGTGTGVAIGGHTTNVIKAISAVQLNVLTTNLS